ncbi:hypothetical protein ASC77_17550 [Nocardioides sp. Root1257]|uniref:hypothetical protein n=1 Tax=unclassified Nocardioides TaxID=2615069 RepID=UPI000701C9BB|nr:MULTISPECIES: hypothetical protein [unclassified Nocardioides]KQW46993.1 hypothetical protein ASC77_17550 [Nocardioides sp. Root1257]KRC43739.1 hypothetical protein ASE24_18505 [Nocardioides sp. Root224]
MRPYLWTLAAVWLTWFAGLVAASVHDDHAGVGTAYLVWFVGIPVSVLISVLACAAIAGAQCLEAGERRRTGERG